MHHHILGPRLRSRKGRPPAHPSSPPPRPPSLQTLSFLSLYFPPLTHYSLPSSLYIFYSARRELMLRSLCTEFFLFSISLPVQCGEGGGSLTSPPL